MSSPSPLSLDGISRRQLHLVLALDCSGSMWGDRIASLNYAIRTVVPAIRDVAADNPETDVRIRALSFSTRAQWLNAEAVPIDDFVWNDLAAGGETAMGAALRMLAESLSPERMPGRQLPPVVVLVTDGQPSDEFEAGIAAFESSPYGSKATRIAIAIGSDTDMSVLQRFIGHAAYPPLKAVNAKDLVERIRWATTTPVKAVSQPTTDPDPLRALARSAKTQVTTASDMIW